MELTSLVYSIAGFLIILLLGIIGFFLKRQITVIECLTESVNALKTSMEVVRTNETNFRLSCGIRHGSIDKLVETHGTRIDDHDKQIATLHERTSRKTRAK